MFEGESGLCRFINSDPIALAYQVLDRKTTLTYDVKTMLIQRLLNISGEPSAVVPKGDIVIGYYNTEGKADVADLAVRIRDSGRTRQGRNKQFDSNGLYAVTID